MELKEFLTWLLSSGGSSAVVSFILERVPAFQKLESEQKRWGFFLACVLVSVGSYLTLTYVPKEVLDQIAPFFALIATVFISVFTGSAFHKVDKIETGQG